MSSKWIVLAIFCIIGFWLDPTRGCKREPMHLPHGSKQSGDNGYHIYIGDEPKSYQPGKIYNGNRNRTIKKENNVLINNLFRSLFSYRKQFLFWAPKNLIVNLNLPVLC